MDEGSGDSAAWLLCHPHQTVNSVPHNTLSWPFFAGWLIAGVSIWRTPAVSSHTHLDRDRCPSSSPLAAPGCLTAPLAVMPTCSSLVSILCHRPIWGLALAPATQNNYQAACLHCLDACSDADSGFTRSIAAMASSCVVLPLYPLIGSTSVCIVSNLFRSTRLCGVFARLACARWHFSSQKDCSCMPVS